MPDLRKGRYPAYIYPLKNGMFWCKVLFSKDSFKQKGGDKVLTY